jgi:opacity protein-like surface antigen
MKKLFLTFSIPILFMSFASAQIKLGYKAGVNVSSIKKTHYNQYTALPGINTGLFSNVYLSDKYYVDVELLLSVKGYNSILIPAGTTSHRLSYISVPVLMGYKPSQKFSFVLGPEMNFLTKATMKNKNGKKTISDDFEKFDFGIDAGAAYHLSKKISLGVRYNYGLSKVIEEKMFDPSGDMISYKESGANRVIQLNLSYLF